jgi:hypothetical protein
MTGTAHFDRINPLAGEMAIVGKPLDDEDVASYILAELVDEYDGFMVVIITLI